MICDICGKNEATIHIEEIAEGKSKTVHLCGDCMAKNPATGGIDVSPFNLAELVFNLSSKFGTKPAGATDEAKVQPELAKMKCPVCGWTGNDLRSTGLFGCPSCYRSFGDFLAPALGGMHRGSEHAGKRPAGSGASVETDEIASRIAELRRELAECVKAENYEQAAVLRDRISELSCESGGGR